MADSRIDSKSVLLDFSNQNMSIKEALKPQSAIKIDINNTIYVISASFIYIYKLKSLNQHIYSISNKIDLKHLITESLSPTYTDTFTSFFNEKPTKDMASFNFFDNI